MLGKLLEQQEQRGSTDVANNGTSGADYSPASAPANISSQVQVLLEGIGFGRFQRRALALMCFGEFGPMSWILEPVFTNPDRETAGLLTAEQLALTSTAFFAGWAMITPLVAQLADRFGRRPVALSCYCAATVFAVASGFAHSFVTLAFFRAALGASTGAAVAVKYIWMTELMPPSMVSWATSAYTTSFSIMSLWLCLIAHVMESKAEWGLRSWPASYTMIMIASAVPNMLFILLAISPSRLPETAAFYASVGNEVAAAATIEASRDKFCDKWPRVGVVSKLKPASVDVNKRIGTAEIHADTSSGVLLLCSVPLRAKLLVSTVIWLTCVMCYYGLSFLAGDIPGVNIYASFALLGLADIPGNFLYSVAANTPTIGRQRALLSCLLTSGILLLMVGLGLVPPNLVPVLAILGKMCMSGAFNGVYTLAATLFPANCRGQAMGICNTAARIGAMTAPLVAVMGIPKAPLVFALLSFVGALSTRWLPNSNTV